MYGQVRGMIVALRPFSDSRVASTVSRLVPHTFPDEATLRCRAGTSALKGNQHDRAATYFRESLQLNPMIWEAFEGLCALGTWRVARSGSVADSPQAKSPNWT